MIDALAVGLWFLIGLFAGVLPGVWLITLGGPARVIGGIFVIIFGYVLGGVIVEWVIEKIEGEKMPGKQIKNWRKYHALRRQGKSKTSAAKIANSTRKKGKR
jgi:hypothetical protein